MTDEKKQNRTKVLIISFIVLAVVLIAAGTAIILQAPHDGAEAALSLSSSLDENIRNSTVSLTDDEFEYGMNNMIPASMTDSSTLRSECKRIETYYHDNLQVSCATEILNFFGVDSLRLTLKNVGDLTQVLTPLKDSSVFKRIHILLISDTTGFEYAEYLYADNELYTVYEPHTLQIVEPSAEIVDLAEALSQKYGVSTESIQCSDSELKIDLSDLAASDVISVFDDCWQYLLLYHPGINLTLCSGDVLLASAKVVEDWNYTRYYPNNDLAPLFRLTYYYQNNFFKNSIHSACQLYL